MLSSLLHRIQSRSNLTNFGFTLIELLVVIAVIGILAGGVIVIIDPGEQLARGKDASRKAKITQLGKALETYAVDNGTYLATESTTWMDTFVSRGYIKAVVPAVTGNKACTADPAQNGFCYSYAAPNGYIYTYVESKAEATKCSGGVGGASSTVYYVYDTSVGKACIKCASSITGACNATQ